MDNDMPPLTSKIEALPLKGPSPKPPRQEVFVKPAIKLEEGEIYERKINVQSPLILSSSSPPPPIEDRSGLLGESDNNNQHACMQSLHNELELSIYEYAALVERYRTLSGQRSELRKLASAYDDIIRGCSSYEDPAASVEQLRIEAGREGLRAKALEADVLRPIIREAGGLQALTFQVQSVRSLIEQAGGLQELREAVMDAHRLRLRVGELGGLQGLDHLVSQVSLMRSEHREHAELKAEISGPDGLRAKALKYDLLQQAFAAIERSPAFGRMQGGHVSASSGSTQTIKSTAPASEPTVVMNPARARLLSTVPRARDPDRDLYEPRALGRKSSTKTGSNDVPLGPPRSSRHSVDQDYSVEVTRKRKPEEEPQGNVAKRPRVDIGAASALVQATLAGASIDAARSNADQLRVAVSRRIMYGNRAREDRESMGCPW